MLSGLSRAVMPFALADDIMSHDPAADTHDGGRGEERKHAIPVRNQPAHSLRLSETRRLGREG